MATGRGAKAHTRPRMNLGRSAARCRRGPRLRQAEGLGRPTTTCPAVRCRACSVGIAVVPFGIDCMRTPAKDSVGACGLCVAFRPRNSCACMGGRQSLVRNGLGWQVHRQAIADQSRRRVGGPADGLAAMWAFLRSARGVHTMRCRCSSEAHGRMKILRAACEPPARFCPPIRRRDTACRVPTRGNWRATPRPRRHAAAACKIHPTSDQRPATNDQRPTTNRPTPD